MIAIGQEQQLGKKAFLLFLSRKVTAAIVILLVAFILADIGPSISQGIAGITAIGGSASYGTASSISGGIAYASMLLFLLGVIVFLIGFIISLLQYRNYAFVMEEFDMKMRRGVTNQRVISIPYRQIQAVNVVRSLAYRFFGVSKLVMITAGHDDPGTNEEADTVLDPIDKDTAEEIRVFLERKIGVQVTEGTVQADKEEEADKDALPRATI
jgi:uncharacterized membrane protein YdbT with pleckstrin-like domain